MEPNQGATEDQLDKVRKLLAKAESTDSEHERNALLDKVAQLVDKWGIDQTLLAAKAGAKQTIEYTHHASKMPTTYEKENVYIGIRVAKAVGAQALYFGTYGYTPQGRYRTNVTELGLVAADTQREQILMLWYSLEVQCSYELQKTIKKNPQWSYMTGMQKYKFRRSFIIGFGERVGERLKNLHQRTVDEAVKTSGAPGVALVIQTQEQALVARYNAIPGVKPIKGRNYGHGLNEGREAGNRAQLGQTDLKNSSGRALQS